MSDIHGCLDAFLDALSLVDLEDKNNKLVLCGDYIHGGSDSYAVVEKIIELKKKYKSKVVVLMGNHEHWVIEQGMPIVDEYRDEGEYDEKRENKCIDFISQMELYYDGCSHYYIDGDALKNGVVLVLMYDTDAKKFYEVTELENKELKHTNKNKKNTKWLMMYKNK